MAPTAINHLHIPIFSGQDAFAINTPQAREQALRDVSTPSGSALLSACYQSFITELSTLSLHDLEVADVNLADFLMPSALITLPDVRYRYNPAISSPTFFLFQTLRYLAFIEDVGETTDSVTPFTDILQRNAENGTGILGFSSGILPAVVVGTSPNSSTFISRAVEAYRLAVWIGVRTQAYRRQLLSTVPLDHDPCLPWGLVLTGLTRDAMDSAVHVFNEQIGHSAIFVTAITDGSCFTISGRPDYLATFSASISTVAVVYKTCLDALYHSPALTNLVRNRVLSDVVARNIRFPTFMDIRVPIRSTWTGDTINHNTVDSTSLVELVVDMIVTQPVNWTRVVEKTVATVPGDVPVKLLNCGSGASLIRGLDRAFSRIHISTLDLYNADFGKNEGTAKQEAIAIIGMAVDMRDAPNSEKFWEVLESGVNAVSEIPGRHFKVTGLRSEKYTNRSIEAHTSKLVENDDDFDNMFFKITPREAGNMNTQQRILRVVFEAFEDAGYVPYSTMTWCPETFGCYLGVTAPESFSNETDLRCGTGTWEAFLSSRISHALHPNGPPMAAVDTTCSSSAIAFHRGACALINRVCNTALVGGVNVVSSSDTLSDLVRGHSASSIGQRNSFDVSAEGYSLSSVAMFVLKRLPDAIAENDNILGIIRAIEVDQSDFPHPNALPHASRLGNLFEHVLKVASIDPHRVNVVEVHRTGTHAGDPNELESIRSVFAQNRLADNPLHITSVKSNIRHLGAASSAASVAKLLLMLRYKTIPPIISLENLNPRATDLVAGSSITNTVRTAWVPSKEGEPRVALISGFDAAGPHTAILLEEYLPPTDRRSEGLPYIFGISAEDSDALEALRARVVNWVRDPRHATTSLSDIAYTTTARRHLYAYRLAVSANSKEDLVRELVKASVSQVKDNPFSTAFVFSGPGSQYLGMGRSLYKTTPLIRKVIDECHSILTTAGFPGVLAIINAEGDSSGLTKLQEFEAYQTAIISLEYALAKLWMSWGITPSVLVGHGLGEYAALATANVLTLKDALTIVANRARFIIRKCAVDSTSILVVKLPSEDLQNIVGPSSDFSGITFACYDSSVDTVLTGPILQLKALKAYLDADVGCNSNLLPVSFMHHSSAVGPVLSDLTQLAKRVAIRPPSIPVVSNVHGDIVLPGDVSVFNADYFVRLCAEPGQFVKGTRQLAADTTVRAIDAWIEIGPHTTTLSMLKHTAGGPSAALFLGSLHREQEPWSTLSAALAQLFTTNAPIQWRHVFAHVPVSCISFPTYPFAKTKFWIPFEENPPEAVATQEAEAFKSSHHPRTTDFKMLRTWSRYPTRDNGNVAVFETPISELASSIRGHKASGVPLCPASVYLELVFAGLELTRQHLSIPSSGSHVILRRIEFAKPLVYDDRVPLTVITSIKIRDGNGTFFVASRIGGSTEETIHAHGEYKIEGTSKTLTKFYRTLPVINRHILAVAKSRNEKPPQLFSTHTIYGVIFPRVVEYAKEYHTVQSLTMDPTGTEGYASIKLPASYDRSKFVVHPIFTDTLLHVAGFVANMQGHSDDAYICTGVGSVKVIPEQVDNDASYTIYCSNGWLVDQGIVLADVYAVRLSEAPVLVAQFKNIHFRKMRLSGLKKGLAHAAGETSAQPACPTRPAPSLRPTPRTQHTAFSVPPSPIPQDDDIGTPARVRIAIPRIVAKTRYLRKDVDSEADLDSLSVRSRKSIDISRKVEVASSNSHQPSHSTNNIAEGSSRTSTSHTSPSTIATELHSGGSSPRTLVPEEIMIEPTPFVVDGYADFKNVLAAVLGINPEDVGDDIDLKTLGLDYLTSIKVLAALNDRFGLDLPRHFFNDYPTAKKALAYLSSLSGQKLSELRKASVCDTAKYQVTPIKFGTRRKSEFSVTIPPASAARLTKALRLDSIPLPLQRSDSQILPLFLIHDGSGLINYCHGISSLGRNVWGFNNPKFITSEPWTSIVEMASVYADHVSRITPGPVILGGWSFGGVAAYETALQLAKKGIKTQGILLIDSPSPINHVPLSDALIDSVVNLDARGASSDLGRLVKAQFAMNARLLGKYDPRATGGTCPPLILLRSSEGFNPPGVPDVPIWLVDRSDPKVTARGWESLASGPVKVLDIPGHHFTPFHSANIKHVAERMIEGCTLLEKA